MLIETGLIYPNYPLYLLAGYPSDSGLINSYPQLGAACYYVHPFEQDEWCFNANTHLVHVGYRSSANVLGKPFRLFTDFALFRDAYRIRFPTS